MSATKLSIEDRVAIEDLLTDLSLAVDDRDPDLFASLVTPDVLFDVGMGELSGRDSVVSTFAARASDRSFAARHLWTNLKIVSIEGDAVNLRTAFATFAVTDLEGARNRVWRCGDYYDTVRKSGDGAWRLASRKLVLTVPD